MGVAHVLAALDVRLGRSLFAAGHPSPDLHLGPYAADTAVAAVVFSGGRVPREHGLASLGVADDDEEVESQLLHQAEGKL